MATNQQTQAIQNVNTIVGLSAQLLTLYNSIKVINAAWNDDSSLTVVQALQTAAQNVDGTLGTVDGTPNTTHPINVANYPQLTRAVSANSVTSVLTQLNNITGFIDGGALSATPGVRSVLNQVVGG